MAGPSYREGKGRMEMSLRTSGSPAARIRGRRGPREMETVVRSSVRCGWRRKGTAAVVEVEGVPARFNRRGGRGRQAGAHGGVGVSPGGRSQRQTLRRWRRAGARFRVRVRRGESRGRERESRGLGVLHLFSRGAMARGGAEDATAMRRSWGQCPYCGARKKEGGERD